MRRLLLTQSNTGNAGPMAAYMRNQFPYLGIKSEARKEVMKEFIKSEGLPSVTDAETIAKELWELPEREYQYMAILLLDRYHKSFPPEFIDTLQHFLTTKSWWDTVDGLSKTVGAHFKRFPDVRDERLPQWRQSDNIWLRRSALLFQLSYKKDTDFPLLSAIIRENLGSKEFFINKAIGWALRQYARVDPEAIRQFVADNKLQKVSLKEALRHLK